MFIKGHISGVYKIICLPTGKIYIGSSVNIFDRWTIHKSGLRNNKHYNPHLQKAWNKYKENNFNFEIIEKVDNNFLTEKENFWIDSFKNLDTRKTIDKIKRTRVWNGDSIAQIFSKEGKLVGRVCEKCGGLMAQDGNCWKCPICMKAGGCGGG